MNDINQGLMQDFSLTIPTLLEHAATNHPDTEVVARMLDGSLFRYSYRELANRTRQAANALDRLGIGYGDMVGTLAWNTYRHFELFYAVPGIGAVCHTVNPRLFDEQLVYIINHAEDRFRIRRGRLEDQQSRGGTGRGRQGRDSKRIR